MLFSSHSVELDLLNWSALTPNEPKINDVDIYSKVICKFRAIMNYLNPKSNPAIQYFLPFFPVIIFRLDENIPCMK